jgi:DNA-binding transcriptional ArsR family regulator
MEVFEALADPTRRKLLELLAEGECSAGELGDAFPVTRPAISRHLRILREAGLVECRKDAQRRMYSLNAGPLLELDGWLERYRSYWHGRLDDLASHLARKKGRRKS